KRSSADRGSGHRVGRLLALVLRAPGVLGNGQAGVRHRWLGRQGLEFHFRQPRVVHARAARAFDHFREELRVAGDLGAERAGQRFTGSGIPHSLWGGRWISFGSLVGSPSGCPLSSLACQQLPGLSGFEISARSTLPGFAKKPLLVSVLLMTSLPKSSK